MNKYKEKIGNILNKIKGNKRILYLTFCTVLVLFCLVLNVAFGYLVRSKNINGANITIGDLKYKMVINDTALSSSVGTKLPTNTIIGDRIILLKAGKTEQFNIVLTSLNEISTKYEIIYKVCTDEKCTKFMDEIPTSIDVAYYYETPDVSGTLEANKNVIVSLITDNQDDKNYYVQVDLNVGYAHNELALTNQISKDFSPSSLEGNLSIIAYVDGVEVETFPTEPNYETGITCLYKNGNTADARGVFRYSASKGWEVDIFGLNKSLTSCRVDFTEVLKVTYEVLSTRYDCANLQAGSKPSDPLISYTGNCEVISDTDNTDGTHTWRLKLLTSGELTVNGLIYVDAFLVGGGGAGAAADDDWQSPGGGGGYTLTQKNIRLDNKNGNYSIVIGAGGWSTSSVTAGNGGKTTAFNLSVNGGNGGTVYGPGTGSNKGGAAGDNGSGSAYGSGQGKTTCEFDEGTTSGCTRGTAYAYGGSGGGQSQYSQTINYGEPVAADKVAGEIMEDKLVQQILAVVAEETMVPVVQESLSFVMLDPKITKQAKLYKI